MTTPGLHPAQNRALRELYATARQLGGHWPEVAARLGHGPGTEELEAGAAAARELLDELAEVTPGYGLYGRPAAQGVGDRLAAARNAVADRTLERNQALRLALLDVQHAVTLLAYLGALATGQGDERLAEVLGRWERKLKRLEGRVRRAVAELAANPDAAIEPLDQGALGRAGHRVAHTMGTLGEWLDRRAAGRDG